MHDDDSVEEEKSSNDHINESIAMLTKQFSNVIRKF